MSESLTSYAELAEILTNLPIICRETRRVRGLSLRAAAKQLGMSQSTVHRIESGEDAVISNAVLIMRWLHEPWRDEPPPP